MAQLSQPIPIGPIVYFRIVFGLSFCAWATKMIAEGWFSRYYVEPVFHLKYPGFAWVGVWPREWMQWHVLVLLAASIGVAVGLTYRLSALLVAIGFTQLFLADKTLYQNHYYLISLLSWIAVILPAGNALSVDGLLRPAIRSNVAPAWTLWLVRFQIAVPYIYGGIAKLDADWLRGQPMRTSLAARSDAPLVGPFLGQEWCLWLIVYGGLLFDLLIVPALLWQKTRPLAFVLVLAFHLTNAAVFDIGVFPWLMGLLTVIFFPPKLLQRLLRLESAVPGEQLPVESTAPGTRTLRPFGAIVLGIYVLLQLILPLRHFAYPGPANWTEQGHYFAWHMMLRGKQCGLRLHATDPATGRAGTIDLRDYLSEHQTARCARDPDMIYQLCQFIRNDLAQRGYGNLEIRALALASLNGRKPQLLIDPMVDLAAAEPPGLGCPWIMPLTEPLRERAWDVPLDQWEEHLELPDMLAGRKNSRTSGEGP
jgi:vitamin K-dependent gamma-carboxylase